MNCTDIDRFADYDAVMENYERIEKMNEFLRFHDIKKMPIEAIKDWLEFSYKWHDEEYIRMFKAEIKRRALA